VIQVAWAHALGVHGMPFNQLFSLPGEVKLVSTATRVRMRHWPISELESLRLKPINAQSGPIGPENPSSVVLQFGATRVAYDVKQAILDTMPLPLSDGILRLRVISDRPIYEVWGGAGVVHRTYYRADRGESISDIRLVAEGGEAHVKSFTVYPMQSIWK